MTLAYCDGIAAICRKAVREWIEGDFENALSEVGPIKYDLDPVEGYMLSTKKTIEVRDFNGRFYRITVEEI
jgi:hypothetical protein